MNTICGQEDYIMDPIFIGGTIGLIIVGYVVTIIKERHKFREQRDALMALLDSEGRGRQAVELIKMYK